MVPGEVSGTGVWDPERPEWPPAKPIGVVPWSYQGMGTGHCWALLGIAGDCWAWHWVYCMKASGLGNMMPHDPH